MVMLSSVSRPDRVRDIVKHLPSSRLSPLAGLQRKLQRMNSLTGRIGFEKETRPRLLVYLQSRFAYQQGFAGLQKRVDVCKGASGGGNKESIGKAGLRVGVVLAG